MWHRPQLIQLITICWRFHMFLHVPGRPCWHKPWIFISSPLIRLFGLKYFKDNVKRSFFFITFSFLFQQTKYDPRKLAEKKSSNDRENVPKKRNAIFRWGRLAIFEININIPTGNGQRKVKRRIFTLSITHQMMSKLFKCFIFHLELHQHYLINTNPGIQNVCQHIEPKRRIM